MLRPIGSNVLVKRFAPDTHVGSIVLPENAKEKPRLGVVLAVGPGRHAKIGELAGQRLPMQVGEGDRVYFSTYAGGEIDSEAAGFDDLAKDETLLIMDEGDILAIVKEEEGHHGGT